jgi:hypothetical protein
MPNAPTNKPPAVKKPKLPKDPVSIAFRQAVELMMDKRKVRINELIAKGHKRDTIVVVEHQGFPKFSIEGDTVFAHDVSVIRLAKYTDKRDAKQIRPGDIWIKHETKNATVKVKVTEVKIVA